MLEFDEVIEMKEIKVVLPDESGIQKGYDTGKAERTYVSPVPVTDLTERARDVYRLD